MEQEAMKAPSAVATNGKDAASASKCPVAHGGPRGRRNRDWWPDALDISVLHRNSALSDPMGEGFDYAKEFESLDLDAVIAKLLARPVKDRDNQAKVRAKLLTILQFHTLRDSILDAFITAKETP